MLPPVTLLHLRQILLYFSRCISTFQIVGVLPGFSLKGSSIWPRRPSHLFFSGWGRTTRLSGHFISWHLEGKSWSEDWPGLMVWKDYLVLIWVTDFGLSRLIRVVPKTKGQTDILRVLNISLQWPLQWAESVAITSWSVCKIIKGFTDRCYGVYTNSYNT